MYIRKLPFYTVLFKKKSRKIHQSHDGKTQGRGNLVTFLSNTTVNYIIEAISKLIKNKNFDRNK